MNASIVRPVAGLFITVARLLKELHVHSTRRHLAFATVVGFGAIWSVYGALMGTFLAESFTADVRYTGISLGYQVGAAIVGGPAPLIATALVGNDNNYPLVGVFIAFCAAVSFIAVMMTRDRSGQVLDS